jgi:hypothetical protein
MMVVETRSENIFRDAASQQASLVMGEVVGVCVVQAAAAPLIRVSVAVVEAEVVHEDWLPV